MHFFGQMTGLNLPIGDSCLAPGDLVSPEEVTGLSGGLGVSDLVSSSLEEPFCWALNAAAKAFCCNRLNSC